MTIIIDDLNLYQLHITMNFSLEKRSRTLLQVVSGVF